MKPAGDAAPYAISRRTGGLHDTMTAAGGLPSWCRHAGKPAEHLEGPHLYDGMTAQFFVGAGGVSMCAGVSGGG